MHADHPHLLYRLGSHLRVCILWYFIQLAGSKWYHNCSENHRFSFAWNCIGWWTQIWWLQGGGQLRSLVVDNFSKLAGVRVYRCHWSGCSTFCLRIATDFVESNFAWYHPLLHWGSYFARGAFHPSERAPWVWPPAAHGFWFRNSIWVSELQWKLPLPSARRGCFAIALREVPQR